MRLAFCQDLKLALTKTAKKFVRRRALSRLLQCEVVVDGFDKTSATLDVPHIRLSEWASCILVAPATASSIHRIANATCDDLVSLVVAAAPRSSPVVIAPSMNAMMWDNPIVQQNVRRCSDQGYWLIEPGLGVEVNAAWDQRVAQGGTFGATPSTLVKSLRAIYGLNA